MRAGLQVVVSTIVLFVAGLVVGVWTQRSHALPPPPIGPMGEFEQFHHPGFGQPPPAEWFGRSGPNHRGLPPTPEQLRERMSMLMPQISAFQGRIDAIEQRFRSGLDGSLRPDQQQKLEVMKKHLGELPNPMPGCAPAMGPVFISMVIYRPLYEHLTQNLGLDDLQQKRLKELLTDRRNQLLALIDDTPPPSFRIPELVGSGGQPPDEGD